LPSFAVNSLSCGRRNRDFGPCRSEKTGSRTAFDSRTGEEGRNCRSDALLCRLLTPRPRHADATAALKRLIKNRIGVTVQVEIAPPATLQRSTGRAKRLVDNGPED
jgi:hypothetical protein